tara:strand:+ start:424 stop:774 length:351 start_codon:yes stop_codon:yes gene_type:complete
METTTITMLLAHDANDIAIVISAAVKGAYSISQSVFCILPIIIEDEECEKACCIIADIHMRPGAKKVTNENPKTSPLSFPMANDKTKRNSKEVIIGEKTVCIQTAINLLHSFSHKE